MTNINSVIERQRDFFLSDGTKDISFRMDALRKLKSAIKAHEQDILDALKQDLNKSAFEAYATELGIVYAELDDAIRHLPKWAGKKRVRTPIMHFKSSSYRVPEPYGVVLIMSPWNYPFQLAIMIPEIKTDKTAKIS